MNTSKINHEVADAWRDMYQSLFPMPSKFELPDGQRNDNLHLSHMLELTKEGKDITTLMERGSTFIWSHSFFLSIILLVPTAPFLYIILTTAWKHARRRKRGLSKSKLKDARDMIV
eukprot:CAMPEP_0184074552 /NCGR_PEP_ID=MMETSP0957-20130417/69565_1 /TAXON_ID=627963 /ORGANISM="Aplanochytrium sp, Strain PBS07" /LENGTH=115 /DNA_ID=CAMNT_0026376775 /DNA_START=33 /DNA_END=380 /DNA_ORIENTATION=-